MLAADEACSVLRATPQEKNWLDRVLSVCEPMCEPACTPTVHQDARFDRPGAGQPPNLFQASSASPKVHTPDQKRTRVAGLQRAGMGGVEMAAQTPHPASRNRGSTEREGVGGDQPTPSPRSG